MDLPEVEAHVREAAVVEKLVADLCRTSDGYVEASLSRSSDTTPGGTAMLFTNGAEAFHLRLDNRFYVREFEYEPDGQRQALVALVGFPEARHPEG